MPRGSKPGERRGGRQKGTPNKKTLLARARAAAAAADPDLSPLNFFLSLMRDQAIPITTRVAMAQRALPYVHSKSRTGHLEPTGIKKQGTSSEVAAPLAPIPTGAKSRRSWQADASVIDLKEVTDSCDATPLGFLLQVMRNPRTPLKLSMKVASITAPYVHSKRANDRPSKLGATAVDKFGMVVDLEVAQKLRDDKRRLRQLSHRRLKHPDEYDRKAPRLEARIASATAKLNCPCPSVYSIDDFIRDRHRLQEFLRKRKSRAKFTKQDDVDEAQATARVAAFIASPEIVTRTRMKELDRRQGMSRAGGQPFSLAEEGELRGLTTLYPKALPPDDPSRDEIRAFNSAFVDMLDGNEPKVGQAANSDATSESETEPLPSDLAATA